METNLAMLSAAKDVSATVSSLVSTYKTFRGLRKRDIILLKEQIKTFQATCRTKGMGELIRTNIDEISKTQRFIDQQNLEAITLQMAMYQLEQLNKMLNKNLEEYMNGY